MKLEVNHKKKNWKTTNTWRLKNILINNEWVNQKVLEKIKKEYMETNVKENTMFQNLWDTGKAVIRGKCKTVQAYLMMQ